MGQFTNVIVGLSTAFIGYIIGRLWQRFADWLRYRNAKRFLAPVLKGGLQVIVSRFSIAKFPEPTGVVGGGDALALRELASLFGDVGFKNFNTVYVDEGRVDRRTNLVLLGGLDTNQVTTDAMGLIRPAVTIYDPGPGIKMEVHDLTPEKSSGKVSANEKTPRHIYKATANVDYGIIVRAHNPFNPDKSVIIIAGAYGYGSWGGMDLIREDSFQQKCKQLDLSLNGSTNSALEARSSRLRILIATLLSHVKNIASGNGRRTQWSQFECIFRVRIFDNRPLAPEVLVFRPLPHEG
jgi:hypothetical protein